MRKFLLIVFLFLTTTSQIFASETLLNTSMREYPLKNTDLYLNTISAISENKFEILELQSKNGLILFRANKMEFLATVYVAKKGAGLKILPANSDFSLGLNVPSLIFNSIDGITVKEQNGK